MKGGNDYAETKVIIRKYIAECKKPYGSRNLSEFHIINSDKFSILYQFSLINIKL